MPSALWIILMVLILLLVLASFYTVSNMNKKLQRMRRRYDLLLRGHGEVSMEDLLNGINDDIEGFRKERRQTEQKLYHVEQWMARTDTDQSAYVEERFDVLSHQLTEELRAGHANMMSTIKRIDEQVFARMDQVENESRDRVQGEVGALRAELANFSQAISRTVNKNEEEAFIRFDSIERAAEERTGVVDRALASLEDVSTKRAAALESNLVDRMVTLQTATQNQFNASDERLVAELRSVRGETNEHLSRLEQQTTSEMSRIERESGERMSAFENETRGQMEDLDQRSNERITKFQDQTTEFLRSESAKLREQLSLAISNIYLYRYNAFEDVVGETSFSAVLLDEHKNGLILTSIYARQNTTTFAKEVRSGEPVQKLSPEETKALREAMRR